MVKHSQLLLLFVALVGLRLPCVKALRHQYDQQSLKNHDNDSDLKPAAAHNSNADALHRVLDGEEPCAIQLSVCGAVLSALNAGCDVEDDVVATLTKLIQELLEAILGTDADQEMCPSLLDECLDMVGNFSCLASSGTASTTPSLTASTAPSITSAPAAGRIVTRAPVLPVTSLSPSSSSMPSQLPTMSAFPSTSQFPTFSEFPSTSQFPTISMFPSASQFPTVSEFPTEDIQCVTSEEELRLAIESSSEEPSFPTQIGICSNIVVTDAIILDRKAFDLFCAIEKTNCPLNAQNRNRIFFGAPAATSFRNIDFVNGDAEGEFGGGLHLIGDGSVDFIDSRFFNNRAERGGAMYIDGSSLSVAILNCLFQRNQATVVRAFIQYFFMSFACFCFSQSIHVHKCLRLFLSLLLQQAGAIYFEDGSLLITESTFKENTAFSVRESVIDLCQSSC